MNYIVEVENLVTKFGDKVIHNNISFGVKKGSIFAILGASGSGKSVLLNEILMLIKPYSGKIRVCGKDLSSLSEKEKNILQRDWGVLFQFGALYSSLNVYENIAITLFEYTNLDKKIIQDIVFSKLNLVGLSSKVANLYPNELSGGMIKRVALARALALDAKLLFLDEPTSGLDPIGARDFDNLIKNLQQSLDLTVIMITHDLNSIVNIVDEMIVLSDKKIVARGSLKEVLNSNHIFIKQFFNKDLLSCIVE